MIEIDNECRDVDVKINNLFWHLDFIRNTLLVKKLLAFPSLHDAHSSSLLTDAIVLNRAVWARVLLLPVRITKAG